MFESLLSNFSAQLSRCHNPPRTHLAESAICWQCFVTHYNTLHIHYTWSVTKLFECLSQGELEGEGISLERIWNFYVYARNQFLLLAKAKTAVNRIQHFLCLLLHTITHAQYLAPIKLNCGLPFHAKASFSLLLMSLSPLFLLWPSQSISLVSGPRGASVWHGVGRPGGLLRRGVGRSDILTTEFKKLCWTCGT